MSLTTCPTTSQSFSLYLLCSLQIFIDYQVCITYCSSSVLGPWIYDYPHFRDEEIQHRFSDTKPTMLFPSFLISWTKSQLLKCVILCKFYESREIMVMRKNTPKKAFLWQGFIKSLYADCHGPEPFLLERMESWRHRDRLEKDNTKLHFIHCHKLERHHRGDQCYFLLLLFFFFGLFRAAPVAYESSTSLVLFREVYLTKIQQNRKPSVSFFHSYTTLW